MLVPGCPHVYWLVEQGCPADPQQLEIVVIVTVLRRRLAMVVIVVIVMVLVACDSYGTCFWAGNGN
jgi:hypothetical protein